MVNVLEDRDVLPVCALKKFVSVSGRAKKEERSAPAGISAAVAVAGLVAEKSFTQHQD